MKHIRTIEGNLTPNDGKYAIVVGRWNAFVVESLLEGAVDSLTRHGVEADNITIIRAPGAVEIPLVVKKQRLLANTMQSSHWVLLFVVVHRTLSLLLANARKAWHLS